MNFASLKRGYANARKMREYMGAVSRDPGCGSGIVLLSTLLVSHRKAGKYFDVMNDDMRNIFVKAIQIG